MSQTQQNDQFENLMKGFADNANAVSSVIELSSKTAEAVQSLTKSLEAEQEARKQEAELRKSELDAQAELKKSELASENEALKKELEIKKSQMNFAKYSGVSHASPSEKVLMKSEDTLAMVDFIKSTVGTNKELKASDGLSSAIGEAIFAKSYSGYSNDINALGGYAMPNAPKMPMLDVTNRNNIDALVDFIGVQEAPSSSVFQIPLREYDYKKGRSDVVIRNENGEYSFPTVTNILTQREFRPSYMSHGFKCSVDQARDNPIFVDELITELRNDVKQRIADALILNTVDSHAKNIRGMLNATLTEKASSVNETITNQEIVFKDLITKLQGPDYRRSNFKNPLLLLNAQKINGLMFEWEGFNYYNAPYIDTGRQTINLGHLGVVPYLPIEDADYLNFDSSGTAQQIAAILIDQEAYGIYKYSPADAFTVNFVHEQNKTHCVEHLYSTKIAADLKHQYKISVITYQNTI